MGSGFVEGAVAEHGAQDADAGARGGVVQGAERGERHHALLLPVVARVGASSLWIEVADDSCGQGETGAGGQVAAGGAAGAVLTVTSKVVAVLTLVSRSHRQDERRVRAVEEVVPDIAEPVGGRLVQSVRTGIAPEAVEAQS